MELYCNKKRHFTAMILHLSDFVRWFYIHSLMFVLVLTSSEFELFSTLCQFRLGLQSNADIRDLSTSFTEFLQVICLLVSRSIPLISLNTGHCVAKPLDS